MTEDEAKTKWCPFVRTGLTAGMAVNRHVADAPGVWEGVYDETRCIGSGCMAWRGSGEVNKSGGYGAATIDALEITERIRNCLQTANLRLINDIIKISDQQFLREPNFGKVSLKILREALAKIGPLPDEISHHGFCGLAGKP